MAVLCTVLPLSPRSPCTSSPLFLSLSSVSCAIWSSKLSEKAAGEAGGGELACLGWFTECASASSASWKAECSAEDVGDSMRTDFFVFAGSGDACTVILLFPMHLYEKPHAEQDIPDSSRSCGASTPPESSWRKLLIVGPGGAVVWFGCGEVRKGFPDMMRLDTMHCSMYTKRSLGRCGQEQAAVVVADGRQWGSSPKCWGRSEGQRRPSPPPAPVRQPWPLSAAPQGLHTPTRMRMFGYPLRYHDYDPPVYSRFVMVVNMSPSWKDASRMHDPVLRLQEGARPTAYGFPRARLQSI